MIIPRNELDRLRTWVQSHPQDAKPKYCAQCRQDTPSISGYTQRMALHSDNRNRVCLQCGWAIEPNRQVSEKRRAQVYRADNFTCVYCGATSNLTVDHILSQARGGSDDFDNLVTCCKSCNSKKCDNRVQLSARFGRYAR